MPQYAVTVEAATPGAAVSWVHHQIAARLEPDTGDTRHMKEEAMPRYQAASVRTINEAGKVPR